MQLYGATNRHESLSQVMCLAVCAIALLQPCGVNAADGGQQGTDGASQLHGIERRNDRVPQRDNQDRRAVLETGVAVSGTQASLQRAAVLQFGDADSAVVTQQWSPGAQAVVFQDEAAFAAQATVSQVAALGPVAVIQQGVALSFPRPQGLDVGSQFAAGRAGSDEAASSVHAKATVVQAGGPGLKAFVLQGSGSPAAEIVQTGSWLEAQIVQSGAGHAALIAQSGSGSASSPMRVSVTQMGSTAQSFSVSQVVGQSPRTIRVVQQ